MSHPVDEHRAMFRTLLVRRLTIGALVAALVLALGVILYAVVAIRTAQVSNTGTLNASTRSLNLLIDCTTRQGKCYQSGQTRTRGAVVSLQKSQLQAASYAAACAAQGYRTADQIYDCAVSEMKKHQPMKKANP